MTVVAIGIAIMIFTSFKVSINNQINDNTKVYLSTVLDESLNRVGLKVNEEITILKTISAFFSNEQNLNSEISSQQLNEQLTLHGFLGIHLVDKTGTIINSIGKKSSGINMEYIEKCDRAGYCISSVIVNEETNQEYIDLSVTLYYQNKNIGILVCSYDMDEFTQIIEDSSFQKIGTTFISQEDGTLISRPESVGSNTNLFELLDSINTYNEKSILKLKNSIQNRESGIITYGSGKYKRYLCYKVLPEASWYTVSIISSSAIEPVAKEISESATVLATGIIAIFSVYMGIIIVVEYRRMRVRRKSEKQPEDINKLKSE